MSMEASSGVAASLNQCNVFFSHSYLCGTNSIEGWQLIFFAGSDWTADNYEINSRAYIEVLLFNQKGGKSLINRQ